MWYRYYRSCGSSLELHKTAFCVPFICKKPSRVHRFLRLDEKTHMFIDVRSDTLLDTKEKHLEYMISATREFNEEFTYQSIDYNTYEYVLSNRHKENGNGQQRQ